MKLLKSINNFTNRFSFWGTDNPTQQRHFINYGKSTTAIENMADNYTQLVLDKRHKYASTILPVANSIKLITNLILNIDLQFKKGEQLLGKNPVQEAFDDLNISTYHNTYNDFMSSLIKNFCFIDGNVYILAVLDEFEQLVSIDVVNSDCLMPEMDALNKRVIRYTINNFSSIAQSLRLNLDPATKTYRVQTITREGQIANCILFTMEIAFETGQIYQASPLRPIARHIALSQAALTRGIALNEKSSDGQFLSMPVPSNDVAKQTAIANDLQDKMQGVINTGATVVVPYTNIGEKANKPEIIPFGNKYKDYDIHTDIENSDNAIYEGLGVPVTVVKQDARYTGNQLESFKQLYEFKIIPELTKIIHYLQKWILPLLDNGRYAEYSISIDKASIEVFKEVKAQYIQSLTFLTLNEKRAEFDHPPLPDGDVLSQSTLPSTKTDLKNI
jgi:hypothetical protein